jgi:lambda family phage tail tape measure protein
MADLSYTVTVNSSGAVTSLKKIETEVNKINTGFKTLDKQTKTVTDTFGKLKQAVAGIAFANLVNSTLNFARGMQQASTATSVAIGTINDFANAVGTAGGDANKAVGDVVDFVAGLKDAKEGSAGAQIELAKVGVTLQDLATLSNEDIFKKTVKGLAQIEDASVRNALAVKMLGKNFKDIDVRQVAGQMGGGGGGANISAINAAADAQKALAVNFNNFQSAILNVLEPLAKLVAGIQVSVQEFTTLIKVVAKVAAAIFIAKQGFAALKVAGDLVFAGKMSPGLNKTAAMLGDFALNLWRLADTAKKFGKNMKEAFLLAGSSIGVVSAAGVGAKSVLGALGAAVFNLLRMFSRFGMVVFIIEAVVDVLSLLEKRFIGTNYIDKFFENIAIGMEKVIGLIPGLSGFAKMMEDSRKGLNSTAGAGRGGNADTLKQQLDHAEQLRNETKKVVDAQRGQRLEADKSVRAYAEQSAELQRQLGFQNTLIGMDETEANRKAKMYELETGYLSQVNALKTKYVDMQAAAVNGTDEEQAAFKRFSEVIGSTVSQLATEYEKQMSAMGVLIDGTETATLKEKDRLNVIERITSAMELQKQAAEATSGIHGDIAKQMKDIDYKNMQRGQSPVEQMLNDVNKAVDEFQAQAAGKIMSVFETEDGFRNIEQMNSELAKMYARSEALRKSKSADAMQSRDWATGWQDAFDSYLDNATNAYKIAGEQFAVVTQGMNSAIDKFVDTGKMSFGDFATSVIKDLLKIELRTQAAMAMQAFKGAGGVGGILSTIGSFFGGFFADGGQPPIGKASIVGENGPELFVPKSSGTIVPNGGSVGNAAQGNTYITNNISAIDAKSVAQLFAENRKTLFGSVSLAQKEMSYGR